MASPTTRILLTDSSGNARYLSLSFTGDVLNIADANSVKTAHIDMAANISGSNTGNETTTTAGALINGATAETTPVDADMVALMDSTAANILKKLSWAIIKSTLKTYFDTLYAVATAVTTHAALTVTHGATGAIVGTTNTQTLSSKTLDQLRTTQAVTVVNTNLPWGQAIATHKVPIVLNGTTYYVLLVAS